MYLSDINLRIFYVKLDILIKWYEKGLSLREERVSNVILGNCKYRREFGTGGCVEGLRMGN